MNILAIDTSGPAASCAVMKDGKIAHLIAMNRGLTHSETIMPAVDAALSASELGCTDIDVFAAALAPSEGAEKCGEPRRHQAEADRRLVDRDEGEGRSGQEREADHRRRDPALCGGSRRGDDALRRQPAERRYEGQDHRP